MDNNRDKLSKQETIEDAHKLAADGVPCVNNDQHSANKASERQEDTNQEAFATLVIKAIKAKSPGSEVSYDRQNFRLHLTAVGETVPLNLGDPYTWCRNCDPNDVPHVVEEVARRALVGMLTTVPYSYEKAKTSILPVIRPRLRFTRISSHDGEELAAPARPLGDHLCVVPYYDLSEARIRLTVEQLEKWGGDLDTVFRDAMKNLLDRTMRPGVDDTAVPLREFASQHGMDPMEVLRLMAPDHDPKEYELDHHVIMERSSDDFGPSKEYPGLFIIDVGDESTASMFLLDPVLRLMGVKGKHVVMVINTGFVLVTGDEDPQGLAKMAELASEKQDVPDCISMTPIRLTAKGWETYVLPKDHPCFHAFHQLHLKDLRRQYAAQGRRLQPIVREFVAPYVLWRSPDKSSVLSLCTWTMEGPSLLPKTDLLAFTEVRLQDHVVINHAVVPWDAALKIIGHRLARMNYNPPMFKTLSDPTPAEIEALKKANVPEMLPAPGTTAHIPEAHMRIVMEQEENAQRERDTHAKLSKLVIGKEVEHPAKSR